MTTTHEPETSTGRSSRSAAIVAAGAAILFGVCMFWTVASVDVPHDASDAELLDWWQQSGNRMSGVISGLFAMCAATLLAVVANHVHRLDATRSSPMWRAFARSMAAAFTAAMLITAATRSAIGHLVDVMGEPLPSVDVLRYATALNYQVLGLSAMGALALTIAVAFRTVSTTGCLTEPKLEKESIAIRGANPNSRATPAARIAISASSAAVGWILTVVSAKK